MRIRVLYFLLCLLVLGLCLPVYGAEPENHMPDAGAALQPAVNDYAYSPMGRRDPFKPLIEKKEAIVKKTIQRPEKIKGPMERFELSQFRLMAIMIVKGNPRAMVKAPDGKSYTVQVEDYIGMNGGKVKNIETKVLAVDENGMRVEKSPDRIVVEEVGIDVLSGKETIENRYIVL